MVATGSFLVHFWQEYLTKVGVNPCKCVYLRVDSSVSESSSELCRQDDVAVMAAVDRYAETGRHGRSVVGRVTRHGVVWFAKWLDESHRGLAECRLRLRKEYQIMLRLNHPGIVRVAAMEDTVHTGPVILMELVEGETLGEFAGRATRRELSAAAVRLLQAAAYMHSKGVCHLDLKPENVMVSGHGDGPVVKIIDFGMADCAGEAMFKSVGGNRRYGAPEQFEAGYRCDPRADVWSLGKMMAWMRPGWSLRVAARKAMTADCARRPADAGVLLGIAARARRRVALMALGVAVAVTGVVALLVPRGAERGGEGMAIPAAVAACFQARRGAEPADSGQVSQGGIAPCPSAAIQADVVSREYAGLIADHDAIVKVLLVELGASGDSVAAIASDDSLSRDARSARIGRVCLAMDRRIASAFAPLLERCPTDFISRQAPGWATIFDPALSSHRGRIERMLEDFSSRGDSI